MNVALPHQYKIHNRRNLICNATRNASVLHIGCTDTPYTLERVEKNNLLHQMLQKSSERVVGMDVNEQDINIMKEHGIEDLYICDVYQINSDSSLPSERYDFIVLSEVLEHLPNAGLALEEINKYIKVHNKDARLIVSVPNVNSYIRGVTNIFRNIEQIHPDHVAYYSYTTIKNTLEMSGFEMVDFCYATYGLRPMFKPFVSLLNLCSSSFLPCIFVQAKVVNNNGK